MKFFFYFSLCKDCWIKIIIRYQISIKNLMWLTSEFIPEYWRRKFENMKNLGDCFVDIRRLSARTYCSRLLSKCLLISGVTFIQYDSTAAVYFYAYLGCAHVCVCSGVNQLQLRTLWTAGVNRDHSIGFIYHH